MTVFQGIFLSEGTPEGRGPQPQEPPAGHAARSHENMAPRITDSPRTPGNNTARYLIFKSSTC